MLIEKLQQYISFVPMNANGARFFGFSELLTGLALTILAWTNADVRYNFRIGTSRLHIKKISLWGIILIGSLTLLTDLWRTEQWLVPDFLISAGVWQTLLATAFFIITLVWVWTGFISPPLFGPKNAFHYTRTLYHYILKGTPTDLAIVADELSRSIQQLVCYAPSRFSHPYLAENNTDGNLAHKMPEVNVCAGEIFELIGDRKFCKVIIEFSPHLILFLYQEISKKGMFDIPVQTLTKNLMIEAIANQESFLYRENDSFYSGLLGKYKPISSKLFSDFKMVEGIGTFLGYGILPRDELKNHHLEAYCRATLIVFENFILSGHPHSLTLSNAFEPIKFATQDLYLINGTEDSLGRSDPVERFITTIRFIKKAISILDKHNYHEKYALALGESNRGFFDCFDALTEVFFQAACDAATIKAPSRLCWHIQYIFLWGEIFSFGENQSKSIKFLQFKIRRKLYNEILGLAERPNFIGSRILGLSLNVLGFKINKKIKNSTWPLHVAILSWTKKNYVWLHDFNKNLAEAFLADSMSYDPHNRRLVKCYRELASRPQKTFEYFELDAPTSCNESDKST